MQAKHTQNTMKKKKTQHTQYHYKNFRGNLFDYVPVCYVKGLLYFRVIRHTQIFSDEEKKIRHIVN